MIGANTEKALERNKNIVKTVTNRSSLIKEKIMMMIVIKDKGDKMKKIIAGLLLATSLVTTIAAAHEPRVFWGEHRGWAPYHGGWWGPFDVLAGVVIGGIVMHEIDVNAAPPAGYTRTVVCNQVMIGVDMYNRPVYQQQCHVEWVQVQQPVVVQPQPQPQQ